MTLLFSLSEFGRTFATRERGAELRDAVLARRSGESVVVIDFAHVTNVSYSFADEFVGKLSSDGDQGGPQVEVVNMNTTIGRTIRRAQDRRAGIVAP